MIILISSDGEAGTGRSAKITGMRQTRMGNAGLNGYATIRKALRRITFGFCASSSRRLKRGRERWGREMKDPNCVVCRDLSAIMHLATPKGG